MTNFEYEDWAMIYNATIAQFDHWSKLAMRTEESDMALLQHRVTQADDFARLAQKIEKMANERFPTLETH